MSRASRAGRNRGQILITGGAGFIGCNLADRLANSGIPVTLFDSLARPGVERNVAWLKERHPALVSLIIGDVRDRWAITDAVRDAAAVFHLAAQVAVTSSLNDPVEDFEINAGGTLAVLEAVRAAGGEAPVVLASTNKVYGSLGDLALALNEDRGCYEPTDERVLARGLSEDRPLDFHTPYGCSKGTADQYALDYARSFGLRTAVMRMSCIYGARQMGTEDQGWVAHFVKRALAGQPISIYGDGGQVRDILYVADAVAAYVAALERIDHISGRAFNLGGGPENAVSLLQLISALETLLGRTIEMKFHPWRAGDQRYYVSDVRAARRELGLPPPIHWRAGLAQLVAWLSEEMALPAPRSRRRSADDERAFATEAHA